jgi:hypothetical protein
MIYGFYVVIILKREKMPEVYKEKISLDKN